jgi:hypothetical protein
MTRRNRLVLSPSKSAKRKPKLELFNTIFSSFLGGIFFADGIRHFKTSRNEYDWIFDFFMAAAWVLIATVSGIRLIKPERTEPFKVDSDSVLTLTDSVQK